MYIKVASINKTRVGGISKGPEGGPGGYSIVKHSVKGEIPRACFINTPELLGKAVPQLVSL